MKVAKFGGSSVANAAQFKKVKQIITSDSSRKAIVVSAAGKSADQPVKVTDLLIRINRLRRAGENYLATFDQLKKRILSIRDGLKLNLDIESDLMAIFNRIDSCSYDYLVSRGEFLSGKLMAAYLGFQFIDPAQFLLFENGRVDLEKSREQLMPLLKANQGIVVPGFYGADEFGMIHLMPRGGSDISGALLANILDANLYENWTDVSGIKMADPNIVNHSKKIDRISYDELHELSLMGAKVFQEDAILPVKQKGIPVAVLNTNRPQEGGTLVVNSSSTEKHEVVGIAGKRDFVVISVKKPGLNQHQDSVAKISAILRKFDLNVDFAPFGPDVIDLLVSEKDKHCDLKKLVKVLKEQLSFQEVNVQDNIALVAAVSSHLRMQPALACRLAAALDSKDIPVHLVIQKDQDIKVLFGVSNSEYAETIKNIYSNILSLMPSKRALA